MRIVVDENIAIRLIEANDAQQIFDSVKKNKQYLREWLPWVDNMKSAEFICNFIAGSLQRNAEGTEYAFVITYHDKIIGRIGVYKIDKQNRIAEIGYWITEEMQGIGITLKCCKKLIAFCFETLQLNRIEIRCGATNIKSQAIPLKLHFAFEGVMKEAEYLHGKFQDLNLYALCKNYYTTSIAE